MMSETKHTRGPWELWSEDLRGGKYYVVKIHDGYETIDIHEAENGEANASLIAAAPELLEALKEAIEFANLANNYIAGQDLPATGRWKAAIAKAEGRT